MSGRRTSRSNSVYNQVGGAIKKVSHYRRAQLMEVHDKESGLTKDGGSRELLNGIVHSISYSPRLRKHASAGMASLPTTRHSVDMLGPEVYSPLFQLSNLNLPRDRVTMNAWNRVFYDTHPIVRNAINLHASYPISKINITCKNKDIQNFFLEMAERINLYDVVYGVSLEFWKMGEAFPYAELDKRSGTWKRITILNPDYIFVDKSIIGDQTIISLRPDKALQRIITSQNPRDVAIRRRLPQYIVDYVRKGQNIPLDNFNVSHLKLLSSPYDIRGTSIIVSCYKDLMLYDKLRESKFAQADGMVNPMTLVKLGGNDYRPTPSDIQAVKQTLEEAQYDKDFKMITHDGVTIERIGYSGAVLDISSDIELINSNIYTGLMTPKALMDQESVTYASSSVGLEVLRQRYDIFRNMIKKWLEMKIFAPISEMQGFTEYVDGKERLVVPQIDFNHMNLWDMNDYIQSIGQFVGEKQISRQTLYRTLGLSFEEENRRLKEEMISDAIRMKEEQSLQAMRLSEIRALDADSDIPEPAEGAAAGAAAGEAPEGLPGVPPGGGLPGMGGGGGLPGMEDFGGGLEGGLEGGGEAPDLGPPPGGGAGGPEA